MSCCSAISIIRMKPNLGDPDRNDALSTKLSSVIQIDSKTSAAVQIADVMIGAAIEAVNGLTGQRTPLLDPQDVLSLYADDQLIHLAPSIDFEEQKQFRKGAQAGQLIDYLAKNFTTKTK